MILIELLDRRPVGTKGTKIRFATFQCEHCGSYVERQLSNGKRNLSCGCTRYELTSVSNTIHGDSVAGAEYSALYSVWSGMRGRCYNKANQDYKYYGAKGIKLCDEWASSYLAFKQWSLLNGYSLTEVLQIDRKEGNLDYSPDNCRWVTPAENQHNRDCVKLSYDKADEIRILLAKNLPLTEIAAMYQVHSDTIYDIKRGRTWNRPKESNVNI